MTPRYANEGFQIIGAAICSIVFQYKKGCIAPASIMPANEPTTSILCVCKCTTSQSMLECVHVSTQALKAHMHSLKARRSSEEDTLVGLFGRSAPDITLQ